MSYRRFFVKEQPVHIISRAVDERKIFIDRADCYRFLFQLYAANLGKPNFNIRRTDVVRLVQGLLNGKEISDEFIIREHEPLAHILDFALNVNHYHLFLLPSQGNSIPELVKKTNGGFAMYFNFKHGRKGSLFGSRYKSVPIETDFQSDAVSRYISVVNPLDIYQPGWREDGLNNKEEALEFLKNYEFSSFPDKIGKRKSKILANEEILNKYSPAGSVENNYFNFVRDFLKQRTNLPQEFWGE